MSKPNKGSNINLIKGNKERDSKQLYKNAKALSKYQKYLHKQEKQLKISYPSMGEPKTVKSSLGHNFGKDKKTYDIMSTVQSIPYNDSHTNRTRSGKRRSSKSNTSRKGNKVNTK